MKFILSQFLSLILLLSFLVSCSEQACPDEYEMGTYNLLSSTKELFPYKDSIVNIVFKDSLGNEVTAIAKEIEIFGLGRTESQSNCIYNPEESIEVSARTESIRDFISIPILDLGFEVGFRVAPDLIKYEDGFINDVANIIFTGTSEYGQSIPTPIPQIFVLLDPRNDPEPPLNVNPAAPIQSLLGKEFTNVYSNTIGKNIIEFYYNNEYGIIGFREKTDGELYVFDRFE